MEFECNSSNNNNNNNSELQASEERDEFICNEWQKEKDKELRATSRKSGVLNPDISEDPAPSPKITCLHSKTGRIGIHTNFYSPVKTDILYANPNVSDTNTQKSPVI